MPKAFTYSRLPTSDPRRHRPVASVCFANDLVVNAACLRPMRQVCSPAKAERDVVRGAGGACRNRYLRGKRYADHRRRLGIYPPRRICRWWIGYANMQRNAGAWLRCVPAHFCWRPAAGSTVDASSLLDALRALRQQHPKCRSRPSDLHQRRPGLDFGGVTRRHRSGTAMVEQDLGSDIALDVARHTGGVPQTTGRAVTVQRDVITAEPSKPFR